MARHLNIPVRPSRRGEPTWEALDLVPLQGEWSEDEYLALNTRRLVEFTDGKLEVLPSPDWMHQRLALLLCNLLRGYRIDGRVGRVTFAGFKVKLRAGKWRLPDVLFLRPENEHLHRNEWWTHVDYAIEIVSKHRPSRDYIKKRKEYAEACIPEYWIVDPRTRESKVLVLDTGATEYREVGTFGPADVVRAVTLPGFEVDFGKLLAEADQNTPPR